MVSIWLEIVFFQGSWYRKGLWWEYLDRWPIDEGAKHKPAYDNDYIRIHVQNEGISFTYRLIETLGDLNVQYFDLLEG